jgi:uncharacterized repeat protein (TIGR03803 family)
MKRFGYKETARIVAVICVATAVASHAQAFTRIASFDGTNGAYPVAPLIQGADGFLYGTTSQGGNTFGFPTCSPYGCGTVFRVTPNGKVTTLYSFCSQANCADGRTPLGGLALGLNGNLYGTTFEGGVNDNGSGTVFEITPQGKLTTLYNFCSQTNCPDGAGPLSGLTLGIDGKFYGTTIGGGSGLEGVTFSVSPSGNYTTLYSFCTTRPCADGSEPAGTLALATNGKFYGTTPLGGTFGAGTIFQLTPSGVETRVHSFSGTQNIDNVANGVMQASDGNLYGTMYEGGLNGGGTVFRLTAQGRLTTLYAFCSQSNCSDGVHPHSQLIQGTDGNLYGTTAGGEGPYGSVFQITPTGNLTTLYSFCAVNNDCPSGATPEAGLVQATNGIFYGVALGGGVSTNCSGGCGTIFSIAMGFTPLVQPYPNFGKPYSVIGILGSNLTGTTQVIFNGVPAEFTVVSNTFIKATVPGGAVTGRIGVTTDGNTLSSSGVFHVE